MRRKRSGSGLTVNAIAGTHVVILGLDLSEARRPGCLGFAIWRHDHTEDESYWLSGMKTFAATDPLLGPGGQVSSRQHPYQTFQWSDYSAKPDHDYTYRVIPIRGTPTNLIEGTAVQVRVQTESESGATHSAFFNRGAVATQEYARRFQNKSPSQLVGDEQKAAYLWLSRGLLKALTDFIARADSNRHEIYGAIYEFQWPEALLALKAAAQVARKVSILFDDIPGGPGLRNEHAIDVANIKSLTTARIHGRIMHNKFLVLVKDDQPVAVWTGSTNLTENGIFGHSNCGHIVEDTTVAGAYLEYWKQLKRDEPAPADDRAWVGVHNPNPPDPLTANPTVVFSPRTGTAVLDRYGVIADSAQKALFMTFAFGMHQVFKNVYEQNDGVLRLALMEKEGNGAGLAQGKIDISRIRRLPNVVVAIGHYITTNSFDRWLKELNQITSEVNVHWIHTKYMLVDPLSTRPVVITGSANFSAASTDTNHENMLIIRNDRRVADIYLGEYMRLFSHYAFREAVKIAKDNGETEWHPEHLADTDAWQKDYYKPGHQRFLRRKYFAQT